MSTEIRVAILGGTGYIAGELLRLLAQHRHVRVTSVCSGSARGRGLADVHSHLRGFYPQSFDAEPNLESLCDRPRGVLVSALPSGESAAAIAALLTAAEKSAGTTALRVIDLSGDFRLSDVETHQRCYPETPALTELRRRFVYGMPELTRDALRGARLVSNPGCLATAAILALAPLTSRGLKGLVAIDARTGSSGAGRQLKDSTHHPTRHADFRAYRPLAHQHEPEIRQALGDPLGERLATSFVAHSLPVARGIFVTAHALLSEPIESAALRAHYQAFFAKSPFVRLRDETPTLQDVVGSNFCDLALAARGRQVVVMAALDNLVKGAAGTAIQNLNLMFGLPETTGLWQPSLRPV